MIDVINEQLKNKYIDIKYNKYLWIHGTTDILYLNNDVAHFHFDNNCDELRKWLLEIAKGNIIFLEDKRNFSLKQMSIFRWNIKLITREKFEKNRKKYFKKKYLYIYTGNEIVKIAE